MKHYNNYHQNYNQNNRPVNQPQVPVEEEVNIEEPVEETVDEEVETVAPVEESVEDTVEAGVEEVEEVEPLVGTVTNCTKLRVRKLPSVTAGVICEIAADDVVIINQKDSTVEFYKVTTETGVEGYCMKKYITV